MAEYINKAELWNERPEWLNQIMQREVDSAHNQGWNECNDEWLNIIKAMPTIDIVHCGECKHWTEEDGCYFTDEWTEADWFCPDGEVESKCNGI